MVWEDQNRGSEVMTNAAEKLIGILKNKIYKYTTVILKNVYIGKSAELVAGCNNIINRIITILFIE